jgi:hypothetical protein
VALQPPRALRCGCLWVVARQPPPWTSLTHLELVEDVYPVLVAGARCSRADYLARRGGQVGRAAASAGTRHIRGTPKQRLAALAAPAEVYTMAYDNLAWLCETLGDAWPFVTVIADELTRPESFRIRQGSKRAGALGRVAHTKVKRFIGLHRHARANGLKDLWGQTWFPTRASGWDAPSAPSSSAGSAGAGDGYSLAAAPARAGGYRTCCATSASTVTGLPVDEPIRNPIYVDLPPGRPDAVQRHGGGDVRRDRGRTGPRRRTLRCALASCLQLANGAIYTGVDRAERGSTMRSWRRSTASSKKPPGQPVPVAYNFGTT